MSKEKTLAAKRKRLLLIAALVFMTAGICYGIWWALVASNYESTDDAYVHGNLVQVTSQIAGTVVAIDADNTDIVKQGQTLIKLDPVDTQVALQQAEAELAQTVRRTRTLYVQNGALKADIAMRQANVERAQADLAKAQSDLKRRRTLAQSGGVSGEEILHAATAEKTAESALAQTKAELAAAQSKLETNLALTSGTSIEQHPDVRQAAGHVRDAWLANARTELPAPLDGVVTQRSVQIGQHVAPGAPLMTVVPLKQVWVEANFKEGQITRMKPGQDVTLTADVYGSDVVYHGHIEGIEAGTGSSFALLPAQNASGNWIKVVQRVPVRIALNPDELAEHPLRVGLSMLAEVHLVDPEKAPVHEPARFETSAFERNTQGVDALIEKIIKDNLAS